jgi:hypothetical protein
MSGMDDNPDASSLSAGPLPRTPVKPGPWHPLTWAVVGFAGGTLLAAPLVLSLDTRDQIAGGMMCGGPIGALIGLAHGVERRRRAR